MWGQCVWLRICENGLWEFLFYLETLKYSGSSGTFCKAAQLTGASVVAGLHQADQLMGASVVARVQ